MMKFKYLIACGLAATLFFSSCEKEEDLDTTTTTTTTTTEGASSDSAATADSLSAIVLDSIATADSLSSIIIDSISPLPFPVDLDSLLALDSLLDGNIPDVIIDNSVSLVGKWQVTDADFGICDDNVNNNIKEIHTFTDAGMLEVSCPNGVGYYSFNYELKENNTKYSVTFFDTNVFEIISLTETAFVYKGPNNVIISYLKVSQ